MASVGAVVLAGGRSSRMGRPKAELEWHGSTLLRRVTGLVARVADGPVVVVRAQDQQLPALPSSVEVVEDAEDGRGPLQGVAAGLLALQGRVEQAFVCATDLPSLHPAFVQRVAGALGAGEVALPVVRGFRQPLAATYRPELGTRALDLLATGRDRVGHLVADAATTVLDEQTLLADARLRARDPGLTSVDGVNDAQEYERARAQPAPEVLVQRYGALTTAGAPVTVRAATLGAAAHAVGLELDRHLLAAIDGDAVVRDVETPLAQGDVVTFLSADAGG